jgi:hypothetical protein
VSHATPALDAKEEGVNDGEFPDEYQDSSDVPVEILSPVHVVAAVAFFA